VGNSVGWYVIPLHGVGICPASYGRTLGSYGRWLKIFSTYDRVGLSEVIKSGAISVGLFVPPERAGLL